MFFKAFVKLINRNGQFKWSSCREHGFKTSLSVRVDDLFFENLLWFWSKFFQFWSKLNFFTSKAFSWYPHHVSEIHYKSDVSLTELLYLWAGREDLVWGPSRSHIDSTARVAAEGMSPGRAQSVSHLHHVDSSGFWDKLRAYGSFNYQPR